MWLISIPVLVKYNRFLKSKMLWRRYINTWTLSIVLFLCRTHNVSETGFCLRLQVEPIQLGLIDRANPYLGTWVSFTWRRRQNPVSENLFFEINKKDGVSDEYRTMDNIQKHNICIIGSCLVTQWHKSIQFQEMLMKLHNMFWNGRKPHFGINFKGLKQYKCSHSRAPAASSQLSFRSRQHNPVTSILTSPSSRSLALVSV
jgi:hypothetical protein